MASQQVMKKMLHSTMWHEKKVSTHRWPSGLVGHSDLFFFVIFTFTGRCGISFHFLCLDRDSIRVTLMWLWSIKEKKYHDYHTLWIMGLTRVSFLPLLITELWSSSLLPSGKKKSFNYFCCNLLSNFPSINWKSTQCLKVLYIHCDDS